MNVKIQEMEIVAKMDDAQLLALFAKHIPNSDVQIKVAGKVENVGVIVSEILHRMKTNRQ